MTLFENVVAEYDAARPSYPEGVFDALEPLRGLRVLDVGAGTGIATRQLIERGADVIAVDAGPAMLQQAVARTPGLRAVIADGARLAIRSGVADLVCFAQSWHWLDEGTRVQESHRVLAPGGRWAAWWTHARPDEEPWFDPFWAAVERACPGTDRAQRDTDWGSTIADSELFTAPERVVVPWMRDLSVERWMTDWTSHSRIAQMPADDRAALLATLRAIVDDAFPSGEMTVRCETWLWIARAQ